MQKTVLVALGCFAIPAVSHGETLQQCAAIKSDAERVSCYDRLAGKSPDKPMSERAALCEAKLIDGLVAPASYRRVDVSELRVPITIDQYIDIKLLEIRDRNLKTPDTAVEERAELRKREVGWRTNNAKPSRSNITITYYAQNSYGALLKGAETCGPFTDIAD